MSCKSHIHNRSQQQKKQKRCHVGDDEGDVVGDGVEIEFGLDTVDDDVVAVDVVIDDANDDVDDDDNDDVNVVDVIDDANDVVLDV